MTFASITFGSNEIDRLRRRNQELEYLVQQTGKEPHATAIVLDVQDRKCALLLGNARVETGTPRHCKIEPGDEVHVLLKSNAIMERTEPGAHAGPIGVVEAVIDARHIQVAVTGQPPRVFLAGKTKAEPGDRVQVDASGTIALRNLGPAVPPPVPDPGVAWDDVGGQDDAVRVLREAIEGPVVDATLHARYGVPRAKGVLLCGPPGCGKSLLARAAASAVARLHGKDGAASGFQHVKGPELLNPLVGQSEAGVRQLFERARAHEKRHGYPCTIFLDEADALLARRGSSRIEGMERTIVPMFLAEMDGFEASGAFVIVATNRPDMLDPAILREGRLDLKVLVRRPDQAAARSILVKHLARAPLDGLTLDAAAEVAADHLFADRHVLYIVRTKSGRGDRRLTLGQWVSGAMCAGLVARAGRIAIRRDKSMKRDASGIGADDLAEAADALCAEQRLLQHDTELAEIAAELKDDFKSITKEK